MVVPFTEVLLEGLKRRMSEGHEIKSLVLGILSLRDHLDLDGDVRWLVMCLNFLGKIWVGNMIL